MTDIKGVVKFTVEGECVPNDKFIFGEELNKVMSTTIQTFFDSYCEGQPAYLFGWEPSGFREIECGTGKTKLEVDINLGKDAKITCPDSEVVYVRKDGKMVKKPRDFITKYVYKNDDDKVVGINLPTDQKHVKDDFLNELKALDDIIVAGTEAGLKTADVIDAIKYISDNVGKFDGIASIKDDLVLVINMMPEKKIGYLKIGLLDANTVKAPILAKYYLIYKARNGNRE